jgi:hypothetical protein
VVILLDLSPLIVECPSEFLCPHFDIISEKKFLLLLSFLFKKQITVFQREDLILSNVNVPYTGISFQALRKLEDTVGLEERKKLRVFY